MYKTINIFIIVNAFSKQQLKEGQLVTFDPCLKTFETFPFITCSYDKDNCYTLYERIDLESFPSWNDFYGYSIKVERGTSCIILGIVGYPGSCFQLIDVHPKDLHVYSVLVKGRSVQVFGCDVSPTPAAA